LEAISLCSDLASTSGPILERVKEWERMIDRALGNIWDAVTLPFALWGRW
jgi:hypothetical protein